MPQEENPTTPIDPLNMGGLISLTEASEISGLGADYLRKIAETGRLKAKKIGRNWVTTSAAVTEYLESRNFKNIPKKYRDRT